MESLALKPMDEKTWRKLVLDTANHFGLLSNHPRLDGMVITQTINERP